MWEFQLSSAITKIDEKGRVMIPKKIRETANLKEGCYVNIKAEGKTVIMEPTEPIAEKYRGAFKITKWPEDMDEFVLEVIKEWWTNHAT
jgi:AbrB family looped-hinge helix DNA binding protein